MGLKVVGIYFTMAFGIKFKHNQYFFLCYKYNMASIPIQQNPMMIDKALFEKSNKIEYTPVMKRDKKMSDLETLLTQKVYLISNFEKYKFNLDLVRFLCNQIEILVSKSDGIDKKLVLINVMKRVFSLNQQEIELIDHMIEFIWENELIIKKSFMRFFDCFHSKKKVNF